MQAISQTSIVRITNILENTSSTAFLARNSSEKISKISISIGSSNKRSRIFFFINFLFYKFFYLQNSHYLLLLSTSSFLHQISSMYSSSIAAATSKFLPRAVSKVITTVEKAEGVGAKVRRSIGILKMRNFTPFVLLDHFQVSPEAGFPDHPHRGQETITYMLKGRIDHEDFTGARGTLEPGDLQFMTAGKGVVHAEMPRIDKDKDGSITTVEGLQLWVDLPVDLKLTEPRYRDLRAKEIPIAQPNDKVTVKVISGESYGVESAKELAYTPVWMLDTSLKAGGRIQQEIPVGFNAFLYIMKGSILIHGKSYDKHTSVFFDTNGSGVEVASPESASEDAKFMIIAGQILEQPIFQQGPFVETSKERIWQAYDDYDGNVNGFERAASWQSKIAKSKL